MPDGSDPHVAMYIPSFGRGGIERFVLNISEELTDRGIRTDVLVRTTSPLLDDLPSDVRLVEMTTRQAIDSLVHHVITPHIANGILSLPDYVWYLRRADPTLVISLQVNPFAYLGTRLAGSDTTLVVRESNTPSVATEDTDHRLGKLAPFAKRLTYPRADHVVSVSADAGDDIAEMLDLARDRITTIYNPTYTDRLERLAEADIDHQWFEEDVPVVCSVGRFSDQKDFETLVRAMARVRDEVDARMLLVGDGRNREAIESLVADLGIADHVDFTGYRTNPYPYMAGADVFVLSSYYEGLPNVLIEAIGVGTPAIATDCPSGPREILCDGDAGTLVPAEDVDAMVAAIRQYLEYPERAQSDLEIARDGLDRFTPEAATDQYLSLAKSGDQTDV